MSYLEEFQRLLGEEKLTPFLKMWEEYCLADQVDGVELGIILNMIKDSVLAKSFGQVAETVLPLWERIKEEDVANNILRLTVDLQTTNSPLLADLSTHYLTTHYGEEENHAEKMRIVGLRSRHSFKGAITNYGLLSHMNKGNFVFHTGGWGAGEVMDISLLQEHVLLEFEGIGALKDLSFENAFKHLIYLPSDHFLARRFGDPDKLEAEGREDPVALIHLLLRDLGPKTAQEIKEELCELVIPEPDWSKWWQTTRTKLKKDTKILSPKSTKQPFVLREEGIPHDVQFLEALKSAKSIDALIQTAYHFVRDFSEVLKNDSVKSELKERLMGGLEGDPAVPAASLARKIQISFLLEDIFPQEFPQAATSLVQSVDNLEEMLGLVDILAFKKRVLITVHQSREDWEQIFLQLLFVVDQNPLRDYIFRELSSSSPELIKGKINELLHNMNLYPEAFFWYFQKVIGKDEVPLNDQENRYKFLEAFLILLHYIEENADYRDLAKKMYTLMVAKRYATIRALIEGGSIPFLKEFLLLASKCSSFSKQDLRIFRSLAEVVQPTLAEKKKADPNDEVIWTTVDGYQKLQKRIQEIGTVEMIDNAREIEAARAHGDLRENAEYKFALERRSRLQAELQMLSRQLNKARILTKDDMVKDEVGPGTVVEVKKGDGKKEQFTLLGPWDADPEQNILSFQSKFAQAMIGHRTGDSFDFQGNHYSIQAINSFI